MQLIQSVDYQITLNTGEKLEVSELDVELVEELQSEDVRKAAASVLDKCPWVIRDVVEEAKLGNTKRLQSFMKTPPIGALMKMEKPVCGLIRDCVIANRNTCTTKNIKGNLPKFPCCWEFEVPDFSGSVGSQVLRLTHVIVHAWREGRTVIIIPKT